MKPALARHNSAVMRVGFANRKLEAAAFEIFVEGFVVRHGGS